MHPSNRGVRPASRGLDHCQDESSGLTRRYSLVTTTCEVRRLTRAGLRIILLKCYVFYTLLYLLSYNYLQRENELLYNVIQN